MEVKVGAMGGEPVQLEKRGERNSDGVCRGRKRQERSDQVEVESRTTVIQLPSHPQAVLLELFAHVVTAT